MANTHNSLPVITHILFGATKVALAQVIAFMDAHPDRSPTKWYEESTGHMGWCKAWWWPTSQGPVFARIGAGAAGNMEIPGIPERTRRDMRIMGYDWNNAGYYVKGE